TLNNEIVPVPADSSYLGQHFEPLILLLTPVYRIWPFTETLLVLQTLALSLGVWPIYLFTVKRFGSPWAGLLVALSYFFSPVLTGINLYNWHPQAFLVPAISLCFYAAEERRDWLYYLSFLGALLCNEVACVTLAMTGLYIFFFKQRRWLG